MASSVRCYRTVLRCYFFFFAVAFFLAGAFFFAFEAAFFAGAFLAGAFRPLSVFLAGAGAFVCPVACSTIPSATWVKSLRGFERFVAIRAA